MRQERRNPFLGSLDRCSRRDVCNATVVDVVVDRDYIAAGEGERTRVARPADFRLKGNGVATAVDHAATRIDMDDHIVSSGSKKIGGSIRLERAAVEIKIQISG